MRPVWVVCVYFAAVFLGAALLAPWIFHAVHGASTVLPALQPLAAKPFARYVNRSLLILALAGLWPFLRHTEMCSWRELGLGRRPDAFSQVLRGFVFGLGSLALVVFVVLLAGARQLSHDIGPGRLLLHTAGVALTALAVACLEEVFFRGALFGALRKTFHWTLALGLSSFIFAWLHFLEKPGGIDRIDWNSGFVVLGSMLAGFADLQKTLPGLLNLALVGVILGLVYQRTGSLHFSIGLHAGWIFWLKTYAFVTQETALGHTWFFGTGRLVNGWLAFIVLAALLALMNRFVRSADPQFGWKEKRLLS